MQLSQEQTEAAFTESKQALCLAGAGSGKTRVLISRVNHLINNCKVSPYEAMLVTFTRKAASEMRERLEESIGNSAYNVTIGTMHSVALNYIQRFGEFIGLNPGKITVYSQWEEGVLLKDVCKELGYHNGKTWRKVKKKEVEAAFYLFYTRKQRNERLYIPNEIMDAFFLRCKENNALTYGMIMTSFLDLIPKIGRMLKFKHILVDETQDNDPLQWRIIKLICSICDASLFAVGDDSQCQPAGTMVETLRGPKPIENLNPETDELYVYCKHAAMVYGGHNKGYKFKIASRYFSGNMYKVIANGTSTKCTPSHKWQVKWSDYGRDKKWNVVYLMRQGDRFRIGWCQLFRGSGKNNEKTAFHLWQRARLEKADSVWILRVLDNKKDASLWESILSTRYGIPTITFEGIHSHEYYDKQGIDTVFREIGDLKIKANRILEDHNLEIKYPLHSTERNNQKRGGCSIFEIEACNMLPGFFMVPHRKNGTRMIKWSVAYRTSRPVKNVIVYSMDVEKYHTYIADGLCTKNSIYSFRGADPGYLIRNQEKFDVYKLKDNYRSDGYIVDSANKLIKHNVNRMDLEMNAIRPRNDAALDLFRDMDSKKLTDKLGDTVNIYGDNIAVLGRNHFLLEKLSRLLTESGIDHEYIGKKTAFTRSEEFRRVHAFLTLAVNPFDNFSFMLCKEHFEINMTDYREIRMQAVRENKSHFQVLCELHTYLPEKLMLLIDSIREGNFYLVLSWMNSIEFEFDPEPVFDFINEYLAVTHKPKIVEYLDWLTLYDVQDEIKEDSKKLQLMTIHASKGLEWSMVIIAGMNEGILPSSRAMKSLDELESERRLAYVAYTRARDYLVLTSRPVDPEAKIKQLPSRFIKESL
jgi:DNA helicase-2/ATP-dependent DNA helicase PcrA